MKARHCDECKHGRPYGAKKRWAIGIITAGMGCEKGHVPRFYLPKHTLDTGYGWKRRCDDFAPRNVEGEK